MSRAFERLESVLHRPLARRTLFVLAPIAYAASLLIQPHFQPIDQAAFSVGRSDALQTSRTFLAAHGLRTDGWSSNTGADVDGELAEYLQSLPAPRRSELARLDPARLLRVSLWNSATGSLAQVWISPTGEVYRWSILDKRASGAATTADADRQAAVAAVTARYGGGWKSLRMSEETTATLHSRRFVWSRPVGEATAEATIEVRGGKVSGEALRLRPPTTRNAVRASFHRLTIVHTVAALILGTLATIALLIGAYRWLLRMREHEVSHRRAVVLGALVFAGVLPSGLIGMYSGQLQQGVVPEPAFIITSSIFAAVMFGAFGALCGVAWAGGEGDLRRMFPAKLGAADALLSGRITSRNVGRSVLVGIVIGGIASFAHAVMQAAAVSAAPVLAPATQNDVFIFAAPVPWLFVPSAHVMGTILMTLAGIVVGVPVAARLTGDRRRGMLLVGAILAIGGFGNAPALTALTLVASLIAGIVAAAAPLAAFAVGDLVAAAAATFSVGICRVLSAFIAQPSTEIRGTGFSLLLLFGATAAFALVAAWRGREWPEQELLPTYARRMVMNDEMRTEMDLAKHAMAALLSRSVSGATGVEIATELIPASTVGGDYVDAFRRTDGGLLWIVADGSGHGAAAALAMTLTRGLLLALARGSLGAADIVRRVQAHLAAELGTQSVPRLAIGAWTPGANAIEIARNADEPKVALRSMAGSTRLVTFVKSVDGVQAAIEQLRPGDGVIAWTDGVEALADVWGAPFGESRILIASDQAPAPADGWRDALRSTFSRHSGALTGGGLADDLALLIMTTEGPAA